MCAAANRRSAISSSTTSRTPRAATGPTGRSPAKTAGTTPRTRTRSASTRPTRPAARRTSGATTPEGASDSAIALTRDIAVPAGQTYLRFNHAYAFEDNSLDGVRWDGGVVEYSTDGGASWHDARSLGIDNGYNGTITQQSTQPAGGQEGVHGGVARLHLEPRRPLEPGRPERPLPLPDRDRRVAVDDYGWFIDDVKVYRCATAPETPEPGGTNPDSPANDNSPRVHGSAPPDSIVSVFTGGTCSGTPAATGTADEFASLGIAIAVPDDSRTRIRVQASDGPLTSPCSGSIVYDEDSTPPAAPALSSTNPSVTLRSQPPAGNRPRRAGSHGEPVQEPFLLRHTRRRRPCRRPSRSRPARLRDRRLDHRGRRDRYGPRRQSVRLLATDHLRRAHPLRRPLGDQGGDRRSRRHLRHPRPRCDRRGPRQRHPPRSQGPRHHLRRPR